MNAAFNAHVEGELSSIRNAGLYKQERVIVTAQGSRVGVPSGSVINLCANNYLGLAQHPEVARAAAVGMERWGYGMASVRFICGTQIIHKQLEAELSDFLGMQDTILYPSCFDANGGLFETLLGEADAIISDELNHASIIDGVRLSKARRYRYRNNDMEDLESKLKQARQEGARFILISSDGVFSMDGIIAQADRICDLAERYDALVHLDEAHATGFVGAGGRGTPEHRGCIGRVDIITGTLGKALGGSSGGYTSASRAIVELLRQRSRPYLFSNTIPPPMVAGALKALQLVREGSDLRAALTRNMRHFREGMTRVGFELAGADHPIIPVMLHDATLATKVAEAMLERGVYVIAFSYPVVPTGRARIRTQMSAAHTLADLDHAIAAFAEVRKQLL
ncbi:MAG: glycine C-acetyltransferase [Pseudomonadota bacterium]